MYDILFECEINVYVFCLGRQDDSILLGIKKGVPLYSNLC